MSKQTRIQKAMQHAVNLHAYDSALILGGLLPEVTVVGKDPNISDYERAKRVLEEDTKWSKKNGNLTHLEFLMDPDYRDEHFRKLQQSYDELGFPYTFNEISGKPEVVPLKESGHPNGTITEYKPSLSEKLWQALFLDPVLPGVLPVTTTGNYTTFLATHPGVDNIQSALGTTLAGKGLYDLGKSAVFGGKYLWALRAPFMLALKANKLNALGTAVGQIGSEILPRTFYGWVVDKASKGLTGNSWGENMATIMPKVDGKSEYSDLNREVNSTIGALTNPGYSFRFGESAMGKRGMESLMRGHHINPTSSIEVAVKNNPVALLRGLKYTITGRPLSDPLVQLTKDGKLIARPDSWSHKLVDEDSYLTPQELLSDSYLNTFPRSYLSWKDRFKLLWNPDKYVYSYVNPHRSFDGGNRSGIFGNDGWSQMEGDLIDAYVYNKTLNPKLATEMDVTWPVFSGNPSVKPVRVYQMNTDWDGVIAKDINTHATSKSNRVGVQVVPNEEAKTLMQTGNKKTIGSSNVYHPRIDFTHLGSPYISNHGTVITPGFHTNPTDFDDNLVYDSGGYLIHKFWPKTQNLGAGWVSKSLDAPMVVAEDIWRFSPWRYSKKWFEPSRLLSYDNTWAKKFEFTKGLLNGTAIDWVNKYGHPFIVLSTPLRMRPATGATKLQQVEQPKSATYTLGDVWPKIK